MCIQRFYTVGVLYHDRVAVTSFPALKCDDAVGGSLDRRSRRCGVIDAGVQPPRVQGRVHTVAERRRNTGVNQRFDVEPCFLLYDCAVLIVIVAAFRTFAAGTVIKRPVVCAAFDDFRRQNIAGRHLLTVKIQAVVEQAHDISFLKVCKVETAGKNPAQGFADFYRYFRPRQRAACRGFDYDRTQRG